jgi:hypothetical protein
MKSAKAEAAEAKTSGVAEASFGEVDAALDRARSDSKKALTTLSTAGKISRAGKLRKLQELARTASQLLRAAADNAEAAAVASSSSLVQAIHSPAYLEEVCSVAEALGLTNVTCANGRILTQSATAIFDSKNLAFNIGRKRIDNLRPIVIARILARQSTQKSAAQSELLLEAIFEAHALVTQGKHAVSYPLDSIYKIMTILPAARKAYSIDEFHRAIVSLDDYGPKLTKSGYRLEFYAEAGGKAGKGFRLTRADGAPKLYYGVAFESGR